MATDNEKWRKEQADVLEETRQKTKRPRRHKVVLHNDDWTPMDFVVEILESVFTLQPALAVKIMLDVHHKGKGICGVYPYDVAETKVNTVHELADDNGYPLRASIEDE